MAATREEILAAQDRTTATMRKVPTEGWGDGFVWVRMLSGKERDKYEDGIRVDGKADLTNCRARFAVLVVCDAQGKRLFTDEDADALGEHCCLHLDRIFEIGGSLNGLYKRDLEELIKNLESGPSDDSGSNSPDAGAAL